MIDTELCNKCIHKPVCSFIEDYKTASRQVLENVEVKILIIDVKCFFYEERR